MMRVHGRNNLRVQKTETGYCVKRMGSRRILSQIEPDVVYPKMWRIKRPDGSLSDMVNLTRAQDAAIGAALSILNADVKQRRAEARTAI